MSPIMNEESTRLEQAQEAWLALQDRVYQKRLIGLAVAARILRMQHADIEALLGACRSDDPADPTGVQVLTARLAEGEPPDSWTKRQQEDLRRIRHVQGLPEFAEQEQEQLALCAEHQIFLLPVTSGWYPPYLRAFPQAPPAILYVSGTGYREAICRRYQLTIVGSRKATAYGRRFLHEHLPMLAESGFNIISGLARGIDGAAHQGSLDSGAMTLAVVGHGLDQCYPPEHRELMAAIKEQGAVLSEFLPGTTLKRNSFPARNRILAGLGQATFVVEADARSGSLITANQAAEGGRDVFALPGSVFTTMSRGCLQLLTEGALLVRHSGDIISGLGQPAETPFRLYSRGLPGRSGEQVETSVDAVANEVEPLGLRILAVLRTDSQTVDQLAAALAEPIVPVMLALTKLEMAGLVHQLQGLYALTSDGYSSI